MRKDELPGALPASFRYAAALISAMLISSLPIPVLSQGIQLVVVDVHEVAEGYRASTRRQSRASPPHPRLRACNEPGDHRES